MTVPVEENGSLRSRLRLSFVGGSRAEQLVLNAQRVLSEVQSRPEWDEASVQPRDAEFPRISASRYDHAGLVVHCYEEETSLGFFLTSGRALGPPSVEIMLGGQAIERWPPELFVTELLAADALEYFFESGRQKPTLWWIRGDGFAREAVWEAGARGRRS